MTVGFVNFMQHKLNPKLFGLFVGSALYLKGRERHWDAHPKKGQSSMSLHSRVMWSPTTIAIFSCITEGSTWAVATHNVFPIRFVKYLSSLWISFKM